jgi:hypothetical protein
MVSPELASYRRVIARSPATPVILSPDLSGRRISPSLCSSPVEGEERVRSHVRTRLKPRTTFLDDTLPFLS